MICKRMTEDQATKCSHNKPMHKFCGHPVACNYGFSALGFVNASSAWFGAPKKYRRRARQEIARVRELRTA